MELIDILSITILVPFAIWNGVRYWKDLLIE